MQSIYGLMSSVIDYAGLYPPAQLEPSVVVRHYTDLISSPRAWMLGRLVWPADKLPQLSELAQGNAPCVEPPATEGAWAITCVLSPAGTPECAHDLAAVSDFNERHSSEGEPAMRIDSLEMRAGTASAVERCVAALPEDLFPYFEVALESDPRGVIAALVGEEAGVKFRTGGTTPQAHPAAGDLARGILAAAAAGVPWKATAGLHRALCHFNQAAGAKQFGFLNVLLGAAMAQARRIDIEGLTAFLTVESMEGIEFSERAVAWQGIRVSREEILDARARLAHSFGSCSFDEPWEDLVAMELVRAVPSGGAA
jgi:hypothetical protein